MMMIYNPDERVLKASTMISTLKETGATITSMGRWCKWNVTSVGKIQDAIDVYRVEICGKVVILLKDNLGMLVCPLCDDVKEVLRWLDENNYKTEKNWYMEDCGMTEETWSEWNS